MTRAITSLQCPPRPNFFWVVITSNYFSNTFHFKITAHLLKRLKSLKILLPIWIFLFPKIPAANLDFHFIFIPIFQSSSSFFTLLFANPNSFKYSDNSSSSSSKFSSKSSSMAPKKAVALRSSTSSQEYYTSQLIKECNIHDSIKIRPPTFEEEKRWRLNGIGIEIPLLWAEGTSKLFVFLFIP